MNIKGRLTAQYGVLTAVIMAATLLTIYILSEEYRKEEFYERLTNRSINIAKILIEVDEIDEFLLYKIEKDNPVRLAFESINIYNEKNDLIFTLDDDPVFSHDTNLLNQIRTNESIRYDEDTREWLGITFKANEETFTIVASAIDVYGNRKIDNLRNTLLIVFGITVLISFIVARLFAVQAMAPVQKLIDEVEQIRPTDLTKRLESSEANDEIAQIARSFNHMLTRVETAFNAQKNFISNASHEMRTPLTAIIGQLDVLRLKDRNVEQYKSTINEVSESVRNLNDLTNGLLMLAQTEVDMSKSGFSTIRIDEIVWQCVDDLKKYRPNCQVQVEFEPTVTEESQLLIKGNENLVKTVFYNIMENGCKYSTDQKIKVHFSTKSNLLEISIIDRGMGINKNELENIFTPFYRGSNTNMQKGHGIGLSLVKRIMEMHDGQVHIESELNKGTFVRLSFPLKP